MIFDGRQVSLAALCLVCVSCAASTGPPAADGGSPATEPTPEIVGIAFEPLRSRTPSGDALPHMELTGLLFLPDEQLLLWNKSGRISHHALSPEIERWIRGLPSL